MKKRIFSILLCLCMVLMLFPVTALANDDATALQDLLNNATSGGTVKLDKDYTIDTTLQVGDHVILDLNGHVIKMTGSGRVFQLIGTGLSLTLQDSDPDAKHDGLPDGGVITGTNSADHGGGVYVAEGGRFTMEGGTIYNCCAEASGGGVYVMNGFFTMSGGAIRDCSANSGGGVCVITSTFTISGGVIEGCSAYQDGDAVVATNDSHIVANGGVINGSVYVSGTLTNASDDGRCTLFYGPIASMGNIINNGRTVTFNIGDSFYAREVVADGKQAVAPEDPTKDDYIFTGWYTDEARTKLYNFTAPVTENITLYAGFEPAPVLAITVNGFQVGNTPNDCTYTFASTIPGITFSADDILRSRWEQCIVGEMGRDAWHTIPDDEVFQADTRYKCYIYLDNNGLMEAPAVTVNGKTPESYVIATRDNVPYALLIECELGTPEPILTLTVPFTTTVKLGGSTAPGETTFELALIDGSGNELKHDGMYFGAVVTTDGAGDYDGTLTITAPLSWLNKMLYEGAFIRQYDDEEPNWTYDDTVWGVRLYMPEIAARSVDGVQYSLLVYPTYIMDNGCFNLDLSAGPVARMSFTNTYTYSYSAPVRDTATIIIGGGKEESKPVEENPNTGAPVAANMSTLSVLTLAAAVAVLKTKKR